MLNTMKLLPGSIIRSRTAFALIAATLLAGGSITEASAKFRHHRHHHHHSHHAQKAQSNWQDANASIGSSSGRSFSGMASFYGNESGSKTASGQRFNQNAMTAAHRSLPFGTKLRVTHGGRSVIVTINDRGPFIKGRVLDLSTGAASAVGLTRAKGVGRVTAEVVS
ncbi:septal ring lytic transglycosylase RlpA family protein [Bradyrhizobium sp. JYMT SZCCT0428]|uniref:septal ring lytic transglycosylase RlpA family protein n=1 Tax=Bradyrhizobium sp. JYMT SZCCT0428 TaxID=2807673 RepID=UPI001BA8ACCD|nr:septal ring lytic transglycosylase RlpA family protein [Bradyrhizobium sp. JYMT SZCCT0428]MBR1154108.1 septal ring lytic transglycosylase RlpA family protein [Bradyrhizobium sp. JYMT SZCCT0428]